MRARVTEKAALIVNYQIMVSWTGNFVGNEMIHFALKRTKKFYKCSFVIVKLNSPIRITVPYIAKNVFKPES